MKHSMKLPLLPAVFVALCLVAAVFGDALVTHDPYAQDLVRRLLPPAWMEGGSPLHFLGTDQLGRDTWSRLILGVRVSVVVGLLGVVGGTVLGVIIGLVAGYAGGAVDAALMRFVDAFFGVPLILFAVLLALALGPGLETVVIAAILSVWARVGRVVRSEVLGLRQRLFVEAARSVGLQDRRIMMRHVLPNLWATIITLASLQVGTVILLEASLSFLGAGVPPPTPAWGSMIATGRQFLGSAWWVSTIPGLTLFLLVLATNVLGDWLRDRLDPMLIQV